jgi:hypothetical protein
MAVGTRIDFRAKIERKLGKVESSRLKPSNDNLNDFIDEGIAYLNTIRARRRTYQVQGDDTKQRFVLSDDIADWAKNFSVVEPPVLLVTNTDTDTEETDELEREDWRFYTADDEDEVLILQDAVSTERYLRFTYTLPYVVDESVANNTTIPDGLEHLLLAVCASRGASWISRSASELSNVELGASEMSTDDIRDAWAARASELWEEAAGIINPSKVDTGGGTSIEYGPQRSRLTGRHRFSH